MEELTKKVISIYCAIRFCERSEERPLAQPEGLRRKEKKTFLSSGLNINSELGIWKTKMVFVLSKENGINNH